MSVTTARLGWHGCVCLQKVGWMFLNPQVSYNKNACLSSVICQLVSITHHLDECQASDSSDSYSHMAGPSMGGLAAETFEKANNQALASA